MVRSWSSVTLAIVLLSLTGRGSPAAATIEEMGGRFNHGYTANPREFLDIDRNWKGGVDGLAGLKDLDQTHGLTLSDPSLTADALKYVATMPALKSLWILGVPINDEGWRQLESIDTLESLSISSKSQAVVRLRGMKHLHSVSVENASSLNSLELADLPSLRRLSLNGGNVGRILSCNIKNLPGLGEVTISTFRISGLRLAAFPTLTSLTIWGCGGETPQDTSLAGLTNLQTLRLQDLQWSETLVAALRANQKLTMVEINSRDFPDEAMTAVAALPGLTELHLASPSIADASLTPLKSLSTLRDLFLSCPRVTGSVFDSFGEMPSLMHLSLGSTAMDDAGLAHLNNLKSLQSLEIYGGKISPAALAAFRATLHPTSP